MTRDEMIAYIKANPYHRISHPLFADDEYIYSAYSGYIYEEKGNLFEDWCPGFWDGIRKRIGGAWEKDWYVKSTKELCEYFTTLSSFGLCCGAYNASKDAKGRYHWLHYPKCSEENCPLKHPELLEGRTL